MSGRHRRGEIEKGERMKPNTWSLIREYIAAEIELSRVNDMFGRGYTFYKYFTESQLNEAISKLEEQSTRMETAIRTALGE